MKKAETRNVFKYNNTSFSVVLPYLHAIIASYISEYKLLFKTYKGLHQIYQEGFCISYKRMSLLSIPIYILRKINLTIFSNGCDFFSLGKVFQGC